MKSPAGVAWASLLALMILAPGVQCLAQVAKVNADDLMDIVFEMKKAAATADKLAPDGSKYCRWGITQLDSSDLDSAVSRFLLSRGSIVPDDISASKMWHVSLVAEDLINQLEMGLQECNLGLRLSRGAHSVAVAGKPVLWKLIDAKRRFAREAYQQTAWQERNHGRPEEAGEGLGAPGVDGNGILGVSLEIREAWEGASRAMSEAETTKECARTESPGKRDEPVELNKLINRLSGASPSGSYIPAADMWLVGITAQTQRLAVTVALEACSYYAVGKKNAERVATALFHSYQRLRAALTSSIRLH